MEYTVLARRFRPQSFGEVVGQETISQALRNAIASERVAHAYLFTGARGVGKTSTARILAKSLNCPNSKGGDPCNDCEICRAISIGSDVDVVEIDGASNRGIEEIRDLRANVNIKAMRSRYKIYIIDEVHMLTVHAFNALLKTLEEPPPNVKFVFCTTEPEKVPDTILSRCQRFDFGTIATATIKQRLAEIATAEGVAVDSAALELVARRAAGSMRDSQSLFDQLLAFGSKTIGAGEVHRLLGTAPDDRLIDLVAALVGRDHRRTLELLQSTLDSGAQLGELTDQLLACFRDLMVLAAGAADAPLLSVGDEQRPALARHAAAWGLPSILAALQILSEARSRMKGVTYGRIVAELALVRIATLEELERIGELVALLKSGTLPNTGSPAPNATRALPASSARRRVPPDGRGETAPEAPAPQGAASVTPGASSRSPASDTATTASASDVAAGALPDPITPEQVASSIRQDDDRSSGSVAPVTHIPLEAGRENEIWSQVIDLLSDMTKSHARNVSHIAISGPNQLVLTFPKSYHLSKQFFERSPEQFRPVEAAVERIVGQPVRIRMAVSQVEAETAPEADTRPSRAEADRQRMDAQNDPLVQRALAAFGATLVRVESGIEAAKD